MIPNQVTLHRVFTAPPEKVFRAFTDENAIASWLPPYGFLCRVDRFEPITGGKFRMSFTNFTTGKTQFFGGDYLQVRPNELLKYSEEIEDPNLSGIMTVTVELSKVSCGTEITIVQEAIPDVIPAELCCVGWQDALDKLKRLVEPHIPDLN